MRKDSVTNESPGMLRWKIVIILLYHIELYCGFLPWNYLGIYFVSISSITIQNLQDI